jgi:hypothetical protein
LEAVHQSPPPPARRSSSDGRRFIRAAAVTALVALAVQLRTEDAFVAPLWVDEAWRAYDVRIASSPWRIPEVAKPVPTLLQPSEWLVGKIGSLVFDAPEIAFRAGPMLFGCLLPVGAYALGAALGGASTALLAALLVALSPGFVEHSREFKPYMLDALLATSFLALTFRELERRGTLAAWGALAAGFAAASIVSVFVLPPSFVLLWARSDGHRRRMLAVAAGASALAFTIVYVTALEPQGTGHTHRFWADYYLGGSSLSVVAGHAARSIRSFSPLALPITLLGCLALAPARAACRRDARLACLYAPLLLQGLASAAGLYPLFERPTAYLYAPMLVALAYAIDGASRLARGRWLAIRPLVVVAIVALGMSAPLRDPPLIARLEDAANWPPRYGGTPRATIRDDLRRDDVVFADVPAFFQFQVYGPDVLRYRAGQSFNDPSFPLQVVPAAHDPRFRTEICARMAMFGAERAWIIDLGETDGFGEHALANPAIEVLLHRRFETLARLDRAVADEYCGSVDLGRFSRTRGDD